MAFSWLYKEKVKGLLQLEKVIIFMQRLITSLKFVNSKCDNLHLFICVDSLSLITSDQEDKSIWKILAIVNQPADIGFKP